MEVKYPWFKETVERLRSSLGNHNPNKLKSASLYLLRESAGTIEQCILKKQPKRAKRLSKILLTLLTHIEFRSSLLSEAMLKPSYEDIAAHILSCILDLKLMQFSLGEVSKGRLDKVSEILLLFLGSSPCHLWDVIIQSKMCQKKIPWAVPLFERIIQTAPKEIKTREEYLRFLLFLRLWRSNDKANHHILKMAQDMKQPKKFFNWFCELPLELTLLPKDGSDCITAIILRKISNSVLQKMYAVLSDGIDVNESYGNGLEPQVDTLFFIDNGSQPYQGEDEEEVINPRPLKRSELAFNELQEELKEFGHTMKVISKEYSETPCSKGKRFAVFSDELVDVDISEKKNEPKRKRKQILGEERSAKHSRQENISPAMPSKEMSEDLEAKVAKLVRQMKDRRILPSEAAEMDSHLHQDSSKLGSGDVHLVYQEHGGKDVDFKETKCKKHLSKKMKVKLLQEGPKQNDIAQSRIETNRSKKKKKIRQENGQCSDDFKKTVKSSSEKDQLHSTIGTIRDNVIIKPDVLPSSKTDKNKRKAKKHKPSPIFEENLKETKHVSSVKATTRKLHKKDEKTSSKKLKAKRLNLPLSEVDRKSESPKNRMPQEASSIISISDQAPVKMKKTKTKKLKRKTLKDDVQPENEESFTSVLCSTVKPIFLSKKNCKNNRNRVVQKPKGKKSLACECQNVTENQNSFIITCTPDSNTDIGTPLVRSTSKSFTISPLNINQDRSVSIKNNHSLEAIDIGSSSNLYEETESKILTYPTKPDSLKIEANDIPLKQLSFDYDLDSEPSHFTSSEDTVPTGDMDFVDMNDIPCITLDSESEKNPNESFFEEAADEISKNQGLASRLRMWSSESSVGCLADVEIPTFPKASTEEAFLKIKSMTDLMQERLATDWAQEKFSSKSDEASKDVASSQAPVFHENSANSGGNEGLKFTRPFTSTCGEMLDNKVSDSDNVVADIKSNAAKAPDSKVSSANDSDDSILKGNLLKKTSSSSGSDAGNEVHNSTNPADSDSESFLSGSSYQSEDDKEAENIQLEQSGEPSENLKSKLLDSEALRSPEKILSKITESHQSLAETEVKINVLLEQPMNNYQDVAIELSDCIVLESHTSMPKTPTKPSEIHEVALLYSFEEPSGGIISDIGKAGEDSIQQLVSPCKHMAMNKFETFNCSAQPDYANLSQSCSSTPKQSLDQFYVNPGSQSDESLRLNISAGSESELEISAQLRDSGRFSGITKLKGTEQGESMTLNSPPLSILDNPENLLVSKDLDTSKNFGINSDLYKKNIVDTESTSLKKLSSGNSDQSVMNPVDPDVEKNQTMAIENSNEIAIGQKDLTLNKFVASGKAVVTPDKAVASPEKSTVTLEIAVPNPEKAVCMQEKAVHTPEKVSVTPKKIIITGTQEKVIPEKTVVSPEKAAVTTAKVAVTPEKFAITPEKCAITQEKVVTPKKAAFTPEKVHVTPKKFPVTPEKFSITPEKVAITPEKIVVTPEKVDVTQEKAAINPVLLDVTTEKAAVIPEKVTVTEEVITLQLSPEARISKKLLTKCKNPSSTENSNENLIIEKEPRYSLRTTPRKDKIGTLGKATPHLSSDQRVLRSRKLTKAPGSPCPQLFSHTKDTTLKAKSIALLDCIEEDLIETVTQEGPVKHGGVNVIRNENYTITTATLLPEKILKRSNPALTENFIPEYQAQLNNIVESKLESTDIKDCQNNPMKQQANEDSQSESGVSTSQNEERVLAFNHKQESVKNERKLVNDITDFLDYTVLGSIRQTSLANKEKKDCGMGKLSKESQFLQDKSMALLSEDKSKKDIGDFSNFRVLRSKRKISIVGPKTYSNKISTPKCISVSKTKNENTIVIALEKSQVLNALIDEGHDNTTIKGTESSNPSQNLSPSKDTLRAQSPCKTRNSPKAVLTQDSRSSSPLKDTAKAMSLYQATFENNAAASNSSTSPLKSQELIIEMSDDISNNITTSLEVSELSLNAAIPESNAKFLFLKYDDKSKSESGHTCAGSSNIEDTAQTKQTASSGSLLKPDAPVENLTPTERGTPKSEMFSSSLDTNVEKGYAGNKLNTDGQVQDCIAVIHPKTSEAKPESMEANGIHSSNASLTVSPDLTKKCHSLIKEDGKEKKKPCHSSLLGESFSFQKITPSSEPLADANHDQLIMPIEITRDSDTMKSKGQLSCSGIGQEGSSALLDVIEESESPDVIQANNSFLRAIMKSKPNVLEQSFDANSNISTRAICGSGSSSESGVSQPDDLLNPDKTVLKETLKPLPLLSLESDSSDSSETQSPKKCTVRDKKLVSDSSEWSETVVPRRKKNLKKSPSQSAVQTHSSPSSDDSGSEVTHISPRKLRSHVFLSQDSNRSSPYVFSDPSESDHESVLENWVKVSLRSQKKCSNGTRKSKKRPIKKNLKVSLKRGTEDEIPTEAYSSNSENESPDFERPKEPIGSKTDNSEDEYSSSSTVALDISLTKREMESKQNGSLNVTSQSESRTLGSRKSARKPDGEGPTECSLAHNDSYINNLPEGSSMDIIHNEDTSKPSEDSTEGCKENEVITADLDKDSLLHGPQGRSANKPEETGSENSHNQAGTADLPEASVLDISISVEQNYCLSPNEIYSDNVNDRMDFNEVEISNPTSHSLTEAGTGGDKLGLANVNSNESPNLSEKPTFESVESSRKSCELGETVTGMKRIQILVKPLNQGRIRLETGYSPPIAKKSRPSLSMSFSEAAVQTVLKSKHIEMLTPSIRSNKKLMGSIKKKAQSTARIKKTSATNESVIGSSPPLRTSPRKLNNTSPKDKTDSSNPGSSQSPKCGKDKSSCGK